MRLHKATIPSQLKLEFECNCFWDIDSFWFLRVSCGGWIQRSPVHPIVHGWPLDLPRPLIDLCMISSSCSAGHLGAGSQLRQWLSHRMASGDVCHTDQAVGVRTQKHRLLHPRWCLEESWGTFYILSYVCRTLGNKWQCYFLGAVWNGSEWIQLEPAAPKLE